MRARLVTLAVALLLSPGLCRAQDDLELERLAPGIEGSAFFSPYDNLDQKVLAALDQARPGSTVYMSYYSLSFAEYPKMFKKLRDRGVTLRMNLFEGVHNDPTYQIDDDLVRDGFDVQLVPNLRSPAAVASLHTKFTVVNDELIVTGSANLSASASLANHEHIVIVKSPRLAKEYIAEFEEQRAACEVMRAAMTKDEWRDYYAYQQFPDEWAEARGPALAAKLRGLDVKTNNSGNVVRTYFSPDDTCERQAVAELRAARRSIRVAMYSFTSPALARAMAEAARRGVEVTIVGDGHQMSIGASTSVNEIIRGEPRIRDVRGHNRLGNFSSIHHKYAIVDDETVLAGSFNWTAQANRFNDENLIVVKSKRLAQRFVRDFAALLTAYDPNGALPEVTPAGDHARILLCIAYPHGDVPRGWELVVYGDSPALGGGDPRRGVALRTSRSVAPNWLGSVSLPRGEEITYKLALRKAGSLADGVSGNAQAGLAPEEGAQPRKLAVAPNGVPQLVREKWRGPAPTLP
ncbi:MAG: DUF1669 domain-containing protein [Planctomycetes bacterium]|nr:DUF1669 domain-containing protein [Planctomycetota bacterium]